jgi:hypothetical protein
LRKLHTDVLSRLATLALAAWLGSSAPAVGAELSSSTQQSIRAATFEVVQRKPPDGEVTYERELPMDLIPYQQRTDKYRSIGTAFAIGPNRYVTAAHVMELGMGSLFGPPALRDGTGKVYEIDQVLKFSDRRDFAVFSLRDPPKGGKVFTPGRKPALNESVFAVGNALGEGVVIRDGLYTSDTPEEVDGKWHWLRFSAAASPGNSGGPLVDGRGNVVGIVLRKSPSENLNVALPIDELINAKEGDANMGGRFPVRLAILDASETVTTDEHFALPKPLAQFFASVLEVTQRVISDAEQKLLEHHKDHLFPHGVGSQQLLHTIDRSGFPRLVHEDPNKVWVASAAQAQTVQLDRNGFVELNPAALRLRAPDGVGLATLYGDDKLYMDLVLKAYALRRAVGSDSVRVTSLGKPKTSSHFTDRWGRTWQVRDWAIPYDDQVLILASVPTPEGYVALVSRIGAGLADVVHRTQQMICDYVDLSMMGTLAQWQDYLAQKGMQPKALDSVKIGIDPEQEVAFHSARYELTVKPELVKLSKDSMLFLDFGFSGDADTALWAVDRVMVSERLHTNNWVHVVRWTQPPASLPDSFQTTWNKMKTRSFPYNGLIENQDGETRISTAVQPPGPDAPVRYGLEVTREGVQKQDAMSRRLELLKRSFTALEEQAK